MGVWSGVPFNEHGYVDPDFAMSAAVTAAIKHAAKHIGMTRELWGPSLTTRTDAGQQLANEAMQIINQCTAEAPAADFQIKIIEDYFTKVVGWDRTYTLQALDVKDYKYISQQQAADILSRKSPFIVFVESKGFPPITQVKASAAR